MKPGILVKIYILCTCTLDVGVSSLDPLFKPSTLLYCLCSCIPLRFRLWQFNSFGPDTPSYWKAVYDLHVISSKCCHHLSLFTQLSDPVTFTDKHCPGKHSDAKSLSQDYDTPIHHPTLFMISFWSVLIPAVLRRQPLSFSYEEKILIWITIHPEQLQLWGRYDLNPHYCFIVNGSHAAYTTPSA